MSGWLLSRLGRLCLAMDLAHTVDEAIPKVMREVRSAGVCAARIAALDMVVDNILDMQLQRRRCAMLLLLLLLLVVALALGFVSSRWNYRAIFYDGWTSMCGVT